MPPPLAADGSAAPFHVGQVQVHVPLAAHQRVAAQVVLRAPGQWNGSESVGQRGGAATGLHAVRGFVRWHRSALPPSGAPAPCA